MAFNIGQKVECVGGGKSARPQAFWDAWRAEHGVTLPRRGTIYTVRDARLAANGTQRIRLAEIINPAVPFSDAPDQEPWFRSASFRPVVERKTDISIFIKMLAPKARQLVHADGQSQL